MENITNAILRTNTGSKDEEGKNVRVEAQLTIDWTGVTENMLQRLAQGMLKINISHAYSANKEIPQGPISLKALDFCPNQPRKARTPDINKFTADELKAQLKKMGFDL